MSLRQLLRLTVMGLRFDPFAWLQILHNVLFCSVFPQTFSWGQIHRHEGESQHRAVYLVGTATPGERLHDRGGLMLKSCISPGKRLISVYFSSRMGGGDSSVKLAVLSLVPGTQKKEMYIVTHL